MSERQMELETYRVFSAEQDFKYASETFLQVQARRWLAKLFQQPLPDFPLAVLLENGYILGRVADVVLACTNDKKPAQLALTVELLNERKYSAILDDLNRFQEACKALGLRQDDLVATSDVVAGKGTSAACSALWSVASACVERCYKGVPEFVTRTEKTHLRMNAMSRSRSSEKAQKLACTVLKPADKPAAGASRFATNLSTDFLPIMKPQGGILGVLGLYDADSAYEFSADEGSPHSPALSSQSAFSAFAGGKAASPEFSSIAVPTPPRADYLGRPTSAGSLPSCGGSRPSSAGSRPASASSTRSPVSPPPCAGSAQPAAAPRPGSDQAVVTPSGLKLPLPIEITHQAWAVDDCQYKGLPLRPQPVLRIRIFKEETQQGEQRNRRALIGEAIQRGKEALPAVTGALIAAAAAIIFAQPAASAKVPSAGASEASAPSEPTGSAKVQSAGTREAAAPSPDAIPSREDQLWTVGRA